MQLGSLDAAQKALRQPDGEEANDTFIIDRETRRGKILAFGESTNADVEFIQKYTAREHIEISNENVISALDTTYTAGNNITISKDTIYSAGKNITIEGNTISAADQTYVGGKRIKVTDKVIDTFPLDVRIVDPTKWAEASITAANWYYVCYGAGIFVAGAFNSDQAAYSTDGINWNETTFPDSANWNSVAFGNGRFVAIANGSNKAAYSYMNEWAVGHKQAKDTMQQLMRLKNREW